MSGPPLYAIFLIFLRLGTTAFGGPAMIPHMRKAFVENRRWISDEDFSLGVAAAQCIPGATAMQMAAYCGLRLRGVTGGAAAYLGFGLPAFVLMTALSAAYFTYGDLTRVKMVFTGLSAVITALLAEAAVSFAQKYLRGLTDRLLALAAALLFFFRGNPLYAVAGVCLAATLLLRDVPALPSGGEGRKALKAGRGLYAGLGLAAGLAILGGLVCLLTRPDLFGLSVMMAKVDLFAFGGGYVSLPLMLSEVTSRGIMSERMFLDGVALGQLTPGPIVMTAAFVGFHMDRIAGAAVGTLAAFTPSFFLMALTAPHFSGLARSLFFRRALMGSLFSLTGLLAATGGVFAQSVPWDLGTGLLALGAFIALRLNAGPAPVVAAGALFSLFL